MPRLKDNRNADPTRYIGRWALRMDHRLFRITHAVTQNRETTYWGTTLQGETIATGYPIEILRDEDEEWINGQGTMVE